MSLEMLVGSGLVTAMFAVWQLEQIRREMSQMRAMMEREAEARDGERDRIKSIDAR
jgi:hypothetical protein